MYGKVGVQSLSNGSTGPIRLDSIGNVATACGGKYREAVAAGRVFVAANQAVTTNTAGLAAIYTGLALCNPVGSGKNLVLLGCGCVAVIALPTAACTYGIMTGDGIGAAAAAIVPRNRLTGGPASKAYVDNDLTFTVAPVLEQVFKTFHTGAVTTAVGSGVFVDLEGSLIVMPGYHCSSYLSAINVDTFICSFMWEELDA